jgi:hypothetical protein
MMMSLRDKKVSNLFPPMAGEVPKTLLETVTTRFK